MLTNLMYPPRTISNIVKDYCDAEQSLMDAISDEFKQFWTAMCCELSSELNDML